MILIIVLKKKIHLSHVDLVLLNILQKVILTILVKYIYKALLLKELYETHYKRKICCNGTCRPSGL